MPGMDFFGWEGPASYESAIIIQIFKKLLYFYGLAWDRNGADFRLTGVYS